MSDSLISANLAPSTESRPGRVSRRADEGMSPAPALVAQTGRAMVLLGGSLPLAALWWAVLAPMAAVGLSLTIVGIGIPLVFLTISVLLTAAQLERQRASYFSGEPITSAYQPVPAGNWWQRMTARVRDFAVWRDALFILLLLPLGALEATLLVGSVGLVAAFLFAPGYFWLAEEGVRIGAFLIDSLPMAILASVIGVLLIVPGAFMLIAAAQAHAALAAAMLGRSRTSQLTERVETLHRSRASVIEAQLAERRRIERDLHDGAQQRLVALAMDLGMAREKLDTQPEVARELIERSHGEAKQVLAELRQLVRGIHPAVLTDRGLDAAISAIAGRMAIPINIDVVLDERPPEAVEIAAYFVVLEALANVAKHSNAHRAWVTVRADDQLLRVEVMDDGRGGASCLPGGGLQGLRERVEAFDGAFRLVSPEGGPTRLRADLPCG